MSVVREASVRILVVEAAWWLREEGAAHRCMMDRDQTGDRAKVRLKEEEEGEEGDEEEEEEEAKILAKEGPHSRQQRTC